MKEFFIWFVVCFLSTYGFVLLFNKLSDTSNKITPLKFIVFLIGVLIQTFICFYDLTFLNIITYFIFFSLLFYIIKPMKLKNIVFYVVEIWFCALILDLLFMLLVLLLNLFVDFDIHGIITEFIISIAFFTSFVLLANNKLVYKFSKNLFSKFNELQYFDIFIIIFLVCVSIVGLVIFLNLGDLNVNFLLYLVVSLQFFAFVILVKYKINASEIGKYLATLKENNDFYIKMNDENRIFKHNLIAKLSSIKSVSNKKAIALIDDYVTKMNKTLFSCKKMKTLPYGVNGIIYQKIYPYLEELNIKLNNKIDFDIFKLLSPRRYNVLVEKVVVSLDNAIEASLSSKNKVIVINLYDDENNIYVEIKNSFSYNLDIDNLGNLNYSTKDKRRGLGLFSMLRDNEATLKVKVVNNYFISLISVRKQK